MSASEKDDDKINEKKDNAKVFNIDEYVIQKGVVNHDIWRTILRQAAGTTEEKIAATKLFFSNYRNVPSNVDNIIKLLASPIEDREVRKAIALELVKENGQIPSGMYFELIELLMKDPTPEIRAIVEPKFKSIADPVMQLGKAMSYPVSLITELGENILQIKGLYDRVAEGFAEIDKILAEPELKNFEFNWLVFLPIDEYIKLYGLHKIGKDQEIKNYLISASKDKEYLQIFLNKVKQKSIFQKRASIIEDAIEAYKAGKHSLAIPVFLAQIEGLLWDYAEKMGIAKGTQITPRKGKKRYANAADDLVENTILAESFSEEVVTYFLGKLYTRDFRHAILHGRNISYQTEENSMKLLLFIHTLLENQIN